MHPLHKEIAFGMDWTRESQTSARLPSGLSLAFSNVSFQRRSALRVRIKPPKAQGYETMAMIDLPKDWPQNTDAGFFVQSLAFLQSILNHPTPPLLHDQLQQVLLHHGVEGQWTVLMAPTGVYIDRLNDHRLQNVHFPSAYLPPDLHHALKRAANCWFPSFGHTLECNKGEFDILVPSSAHERLHLLKLS